MRSPGLNIINVPNLTLTWWVCLEFIKYKWGQEVVSEVTWYTLQTLALCWPPPPLPTIVLWCCYLWTELRWDRIKLREFFATILMNFRKRDSGSCQHLKLHLMFAKKYDKLIIDHTQIWFMEIKPNVSEQNFFFLLFYNAILALLVHFFTIANTPFRRFSLTMTEMVVYFAISNFILQRIRDIS